MKRSRTLPAAAETVELAVQPLAHAHALDLPAYQSGGAAGMDLLAAVPDDAPVHVAPGERLLVPTGLVVQLPPGFEAQVRPRSGLALRHGITVLNSPGTIDSDYRGELQVLLVNHGRETFTIERGARIAQLVVQPVTQARRVVVTQTSATTRGTGGFGSTGVAAKGGKRPITTRRKR